MITGKPAFVRISMFPMGIKILLAGIGLLAGVQCQNVAPDTEVVTGARILIRDELGELSGKKIGAVLNHTAMVGDVHLVDTLRSLGVDITSIFAPEHGFRGDSEAGAIIENGVDPVTGIPLYSLYGTSKRPSPEMFNDLDIILFDIQDVGARFYTYYTTLKYVVEAAAEQGIAVWVLDRPNPAGGDYISGWLMEQEFTSFVGSYPMPIAHGLTLGEMTLMARGEGWLDTESEAIIRVIPMEGWKRWMKWPDTGLRWIPPSPNLPSFEHAYTYLGTCLIEGTNLSEGRGTRDPFLLIGAPGLYTDSLQLKELGARHGFKLRPASFTPVAIPGVSEFPKHKGQLLNGYRISFMDTIPPDPVRFGVELSRKLVQEDSNAVFTDFIFRLAGTRSIQLSDSAEWSEEVEVFRERRKPYLLYH